MKFLLVDDNIDALELTQTLMESLGYEVLAMNDSLLAKDLCDREKFGAAFLDAHMPHPNGIELAQHIRNSTANRNIPIAMLTGYADVESMRGAFKAGITFFLSKPIDRKKLAGLLTAMQRAMMNEGRICVRLPVQTVVDCRASEFEFKAVSIDISESGMLLEGARGVATGQIVELEFALPGNAETISARATVVRVEEEGRMAVKFAELRDKALKTIRDYIAGGLTN